MAGTCFRWPVDREVHVKIFETLAEGQFLRMVRRGSWEMVQRVGISGIVGMIAVTDDGQLVLVEQYRPPVDATVIEIPAGLAGDTEAGRDEPLAEAARRELLEETGYQAEFVEPVAVGAPSAGLSDEMTTLFLCTGLVRVGAGGGDDSEQIAVTEVPLAEVETHCRRRIEQGAVVDLKVYAALPFARGAH